MSKRKRGRTTKAQASCKVVGGFELRYRTPSSLLIGGFKDSQSGECWNTGPLAPAPPARTFSADGCNELASFLPKS